MNSTRRQETSGPNLEFLSEPALILDLNGEVRSANSAARSLLGVGGEAVSLFDLVRNSTDDVAAYVRRATASTSSHIGSITLARGERGERFRALAARVQWAESGETLLIMRLMPVRDDQFSVLNRRIQEMDAQLHQRLKENAMLQEALAENRVLVRELQHRVKNNIQQMLSLIKMSAEGQRSSDVAEVVRTASDRLRAMAVTQEALYQNSGAGPISTRSFLEEVVRGAALSYGDPDALSVSIEEGQMTSEEAHCLALIANELVTNAYKHGMNQGVERVSVTFLGASDCFCLEVRDWGSGFDEATTSRSSGLMLVRGLCRQIGGKLNIADDNGARCSLNFRSELARGDDS